VHSRTTCRCAVTTCSICEVARLREHAFV
jgi:hypothetical protein